jgi:hypothetical protein
MAQRWSDSRATIMSQDNDDGDDDDDDDDDDKECEVRLVAVVKAEVTCGG